MTLHRGNDTGPDVNQIATLSSSMQGLQISAPGILLWPFFWLRRDKYSVVGVFLLTVVAAVCAD